MRTGLAFVATMSAIMVMGCSKPLNRQPVVFTDAGLASASTPSITGIDRSNWAAQSVSVPCGAVAHQPVYVSEKLLEPGSARRSGAYPTVSSVADEATKTHGMRALEGVVAVPWSGWQVLIIPYEMVTGRWPWTVEHTPDAASAYQRLPGDGS